jgi:predicted HTH transcriptional regulator
VSIEALIGGGESNDVEFKSTLRINLHTGQTDPRMEHSCLKTIAGFLNSRGGTLIVGVDDNGDVLGIEEDKFANEDKMGLHLVNLIKSRIGPQYMLSIHPRFEDYDGKRVLVVECTRSRVPVFLKEGNIERFYVRTGAASTELSASQTQEFIKLHFA